MSNFMQHNARFPSASPGSQTHHLKHQSVTMHGYTEKCSATKRWLHVKVGPKFLQKCVSVEVLGTPSPECLDVSLLHRMIS